MEPLAAGNYPNGGLYRTFVQAGIAVKASGKKETQSGSWVSARTSALDPLHPAFVHARGLFPGKSLRLPLRVILTQLSVEPIRMRFSKGSVNLYRGTTLQLSEKLYSSSASCQGMTLVVPQATENKRWALAPEACFSPF
jgi:hypothetical protein